MYFCQVAAGSETLVAVVPLAPATLSSAWQACDRSKWFYLLHGVLAVPGTGSVHKEVTFWMHLCMVHHTRHTLGQGLQHWPDIFRWCAYFFVKAQLIIFFRSCSV
jgi:hypothetical protein